MLLKPSVAGRPVRAQVGVGIRGMPWGSVLGLAALSLLTACSGPAEQETSSESTEPASTESTSTMPAAAVAELPEAQFHLTRDQTHARFSSTIPPVLTVPSGAVISVETEEATDGQLSPESTVDEVAKVAFDPIHPLTGPVFIEGAEPGDVLKVELLEIELGAWGWAGIFPGFGFLADEFDQPYLKTFRFEPGQEDVEFVPGVRVPLRPFPGVVGVAPATEEMLSTIPPRANGGNMDDRELTEGVTVYLPIFVEGALFSIGDTHAAQGDGEVSGTAIEAPTRILLRVEVLKGARPIAEPQYEHEDFYAVTAFGETLDEAAKKATRYMVDYLVEERGLERQDAYVLASIAGRLKIAEVVDVPHMLVTMKMPKSVFE